jgi:hypothetical protein
MTGTILDAGRVRFVGLWKIGDVSCDWLTQKLPQLFLDKEKLAIHGVVHVRCDI